jgi:translocator protein
MKSQKFVTPDSRTKVLALIGWLALCFAAASTGVFVSTGDWYSSLNKPSWNPPSWLFGPVWSVLYCVMAIAAWLVWCQGGWQRQRIPLALFILQLALNAMWTPLFFGLHVPGFAFGELCLLWLALVSTLVLFWRVRPLAGIMLIPYLGWVSFAAFLNFTIWRLNV